MKKVFSFILVILMLTGICACSAPTANQSATSGNSSATSSPKGSADASATSSASAASESKKGSVEDVFGKQIKIAVITNGDEAASALFLSGVQSEAAALGIQVSTAAAPTNFDSAVAGAASGANALIAFLPNAVQSYSALEAVAKGGVPVTLFELQKGSVPDTISHIWYNPADEATMAINAALVYPPHDYPVRLISMFEKKGLAANTLYNKLIGQGKIFSKDTYYTNKTSSKAWLSGKLKSYLAGTLDAVFAEDPALALGALDALEAAKRSDMEVFGIGLTEQVVSRMRNNPEVFVQAAGANSYFAGVLNVRIAASMIKGSKAVTEELAPVLLNASDLKGKDDAALLAAVPAEQASKYNETWMDELRANNKK